MFQIRTFFVIVALLFFSANSYSYSKPPSREEIVNLANKALDFYNSSNYEKSLITARVALHQAINAKEDRIIANCYQTIGANFEELLEYDKAVYFYKKALTHAKNEDDYGIKYAVNNNLGNIYCFEKKQYQTGIDYYKTSLSNSRISADTSKMVLTNLNIAWAYFDVDSYEKGYPYLKYVNSYQDNYGNESSIVALNMLNGMYYGSKGEAIKAISSFENAIKIGEKEKEKLDLSYALQEYAKYLFRTGRYKQAYENLSRFDEITIDLLNKKLVNRANVAGINLELDEYKREIEKIGTENILQAQSLRKSKIIAILFIVVLTVLLFLVYTLLKNNNFKKKVNTELSLSNRKLSIAKDKAEEATILKSQFVSTISHELRTPLYGVIGITNMLLDEHKELANSPHLSSLKFSARYLLSLVNDVLQINKIEENRVILENLNFNISDEVNMIKNSLLFLAKNNNNSINVNIAPEIPENLIGDKLRLSQILINLVGNALKFTTNGEVIIDVNLIKVANNFHFIEFSIKDNGVGIALEDQDKIFDKFVQVGRKEDDYQGTGLGLSIVKRLLTLFGSDIAITSELGVGTEFKFIIAFESDAKKTNAIINNIQVDLSLNKLMKVLVVEDNKINQIVTEKILKKNNYTCTIVDDGFQAIDLLEKAQFDIIFMDINMPLLNGFETSKKIRHNGVTTPIVALTAFDKDEITEQAISAGINDIIVKPFDSNTLFKCIDNLGCKKKELEKI